MPYGHSKNRGHGRRRPGRTWVEDNSFWGRMRRHVTEDVYGYPARSDSVEILFFNLLLELTVELLSVAFGLVGHLAIFLYRTGMRLRGRASAIEATCRQRLRAKRTECVRGEPTPGQLLAAWEESRTSLAGKLRLGALLSEIEPHVDQSLIRDEGGHVVGRRPGIRGWLRERCPELVPHYKAVMAYKALADKVQMAVGLQSKYSIVDVIDVIIEFGKIDAASRGWGKAAREDSGAGEQVDDERAAERAVTQADAEKTMELVEPRKALRKLLEEVQNKSSKATLKSKVPRTTLKTEAQWAMLKDKMPRTMSKDKVAKSTLENNVPKGTMNTKTLWVTLRALDDEVRFRLGLVRMRRSS